jgi:hypothetical protein
MNRNNPLTGADKVLDVYQVVRGDLESFTDQEIIDMNGWIRQISVLPGALVRLRRGER